MNYCTCVILYWWDISAVGVVATEQPEPIQAILTGWWTICLKNASSATVLLHCMWDDACIYRRNVTIWSKRNPDGNFGFYWFHAVCCHVREEHMTFPGNRATDNSFCCQVQYWTVLCSKKMTSCLSAYVYSGSTPAISLSIKHHSLDGLSCFLLHWGV